MAQPQVAVVHQELDTVFLRRDRIGRLLRDALHQFRALDVHLVAARSALLGAQAPANHERRLLRQVLQHLEDFRRDARLHSDALQDAATVADQRENDFAGLAEIIEPARDLDGLADVASRVGHPDPAVFRHQSASSFSKTSRTAASGLGNSGELRSSSSNGY
jgi:hypothetical protein